MRFGLTRLRAACVVRSVLVQYSVKQIIREEHAGYQNCGISPRILVNSKNEEKYQGLLESHMSKGGIEWRTLKDSNLGPSDS